MAFPKILFKEVHTAGCEKKKGRKARRVALALYENILNGKKIISIAVDAFFQLNELTLFPIFWDFNDGTVYWRSPRYFGDNYRIRWMDLIWIFF